jgi:hypothetical protein
LERAGIDRSQARGADPEAERDARGADERDPEGLGRPRTRRWSDGGESDRGAERRGDQGVRVTAGDERRGGEPEREAGQGGESPDDR